MVLVVVERPFGGRNVLDMGGWIKAGHSAFTRVFDALWPEKARQIGRFAFSGVLHRAPLDLQKPLEPGHLVRGLHLALRAARAEEGVEPVLRQAS